MLNIFRTIAAERAGRKAAHSWRTISAHAGEDIEGLTGLDLYEHARDEAGDWLRSKYQLTPRGETTLGSPDQRYHQEYLSYVEGFMAGFPARHKGSPKDVSGNLEDTDENPGVRIAHLLIMLLAGAELLRRDVLDVDEIDRNEIVEIADNTEKHVNEIAHLALGADIKEWEAKLERKRNRREGKYE